MNPFKLVKIFNNECCPCGSGKKYKDCCKKNKMVIQQTSKKPPEIQVMEMMQKSMKKCCMHPDRAKCNSIIKKAHALQNNKIMSILARNVRHVYIMDAKRKPLLIPVKKELVCIIEMNKTSVNDATTETCFCDYHDNVAFAIIEKGAPLFDESREDMKFVYAYKAFIFEYYKLSISIDSYKKCFKINPCAFKSVAMVNMYRMMQRKIKEFEPIKSHFDNEIMLGTYNGIATYVIKIPGQIEFANYAFIAPDYDLNGRKIKHTLKGVMHRLSVTAFPETNQSYILLSCLETERGIYQRLFDQLKVASIDKIKYYMSLVLPLYSENVVLSPKLWSTWNEEIQMAYTYYANLNGRDAVVFRKIIGMGLRNATNKKQGFNYNKHRKIDLFI